MTASLNQFVPETMAAEFCDAIAFIHEKGWSPGTGGNFSCVLPQFPLALLMAPSGVEKGAITPDSLITVNNQGKVLLGNGTASAETLIHLAIATHRSVGAIFHTHSVFNTIISEQFAKEGAVTLTGYEMLKGLEGIKTHNTRLSFPILSNSQDMDALSQQVKHLLKANPSLHGFLLKGHGLYTWGRSIFAAKRHVEILEFLFEVTYRKALLTR